MSLFSFQGAGAVQRQGGGYWQNHSLASSGKEEKSFPFSAFFQHFSRPDTAKERAPAILRELQGSPENTPASRAALNQAALRVGASRPPQSGLLHFQKLLKGKDLASTGQSLESGILKRI
jgi:hypothetical protein